MEWISDNPIYLCQDFVLELALLRPGGVQRASFSSSHAINLAAGPKLESW